MCVRLEARHAFRLPPGQGRGILSVPFGSRRTEGLTGRLGRRKLGILDSRPRNCLPDCMLRGQSAVECRTWRRRLIEGER